jgi:hypothetical protein
VGGATRIGFTIGKAGFAITSRDHAGSNDGLSTLSVRAADFGAAFAAIAVVYVRNPAHSRAIRATTHPVAPCASTRLGHMAIAGAVRTQRRDSGVKVLPLCCGCGRTDHERRKTAATSGATPIAIDATGLRCVGREDGRYGVARGGHSDFFSAISALNNRPTCIGRHRDA